MDDRDQSFEPEPAESKISNGASHFASQPESPARTSQQIGDFHFLASLECLWEQAATADEFAALLVDRRPETVAVLDLERHAPFKIAPGFFPGSGTRRKVTHHFGIGLDPGEWVEIVRDEMAKDHPVGLENEGRFVGDHPTFIRRGTLGRNPG